MKWFPNLSNLFFFFFRHLGSTCLPLLSSIDGEFPHSQGSGKQHINWPQLNLLLSPVSVVVRAPTSGRVTAAAAAVSRA